MICVPELLNGQREVDKTSMMRLMLFPTTSRSPGVHSGAPAYPRGKSDPHIHRGDDHLQTTEPPHSHADPRTPPPKARLAETAHNQT